MVNLLIATDTDFRNTFLGGVTGFSFINPVQAASATLTLNGSQFGSGQLSIQPFIVGSIGVNGIVVYGNHIRANLWSVQNWGAEDSITLRAVVGGSVSIYGTFVADKLIGASGNDDLFGWVGKDTLIGGAGTDTLDGGFGNDTVSYNGRAAVTVNLATHSASDGDQIFNIENVVGSALADHLTGDALNNHLQGGNGADTLVGGGGIDTLTGGSGADHFIYLAVADAPTGRSSDLITDFSRRLGDVIDLSAIDANGRLAGNAFDFVGTAAFTGTAGELRYVTTASGTIIEGDVTGDGVGDLRIRLTGVFNMLDADFVL